MLTIRQVLADFDLIHLRAIADQCGLEFKGSRQHECADELAAVLTQQVTLRALVETLSPAERDGLTSLQRADGRLRSHLYFHRYGSIRQYGPGRLERERPWLEPAGPAEGLWYKGLLGRSFFLEAGETVEFVFVPRDILPLLPPVPQDATAAPSDAMTPPAERHHSLQVSSEGWACVEEVFRLLLFVQLEHPKADREIPTFTQEEGRAEFVQHLCHRLGLITTKAGRLRLSTDQARPWLEQPLALQWRSLLETWRYDAEWNDLWHVPNLQCEPAGWENDPVQTRHRFLDLLSRLPEEGWHDLRGFVGIIRDSEPDFQRPDGDYLSWYIRDADTQDLLMGFEHWEQIEGRLITYYLCQPLYWLGAVDLGRSEDGLEPAMLFRLSEMGRRFLASEPEPVAEPPHAAIQLDDDVSFTFLEGATLYYRLQAERFAESGQGTGLYRISPASLLRARAQDIHLESIINFLEKAASRALHPNEREAISEMWRSLDLIHTRRRVELEFAEPAILDRLFNRPEIRGLSLTLTSPTVAVISEADLPRLMSLLRGLGLRPRLQPRGPKKEA